MNKTKAFYVQKVQCLETPHAFKQWLINHSLDTVIGYSHQKCECPMANFLKSLNIPVIEVTAGHVDAQVGDQEVAIFGVDKHGNDQDGILRTEECVWYWDFVHAIDDNHPVSPEGVGTAITAARALAVLKSFETYEESPPDITFDQIHALEMLIRDDRLFKTVHDLEVGDRIWTTYYGNPAEASVLGKTLRWDEHWDITLNVWNAVTSRFCKETIRRLSADAFEFIFPEPAFVEA